VAGGFNVSIAVLIAHGWLYVVYLLAVFLLWSRMRWGLGQFIAIALGGVVPFLSFFMEAKVHKQVVREVGANPQAIRRY
jgi:integral membrane protein